MEQSSATETVAVSPTVLYAGANCLFSISTEDEMCREWIALGTLHRNSLSFCCKSTEKKIA